MFGGGATLLARGQIAELATHPSRIIPPFSADPPSRPKANVALNGLSNVWVVQAAAGRAEEITGVYPPQLRFFSSPGGVRVGRQGEQIEQRPQQEAFQLYDLLAQEAEQVPGVRRWGLPAGASSQPKRLSGMFKECAGLNSMSPNAPLPKSPTGRIDPKGCGEPTDSNDPLGYGRQIHRAATDIPPR